VAKFSSFDGTKLSYEIDGDGTPVLFLHGFVADSFINWVRPGVIDKVTAAGFKAIQLDQRGHGMSEKPHEPEAYADGAMMKDAQALLDHLELDRVFAVGYSMGAMNTLRLLVEGESRIRAAVLGGIGGASIDAHARTGGTELLADAMLAEDKSTITNTFAKSFRDFADLTKGDRKAFAAMQRQPRVPFGDVGTVAVPVLVLVGDNDPMIGNAADLAAKMPNARAVVVGGSHLNVVNNPEFHRELIAFLESSREAVDA
jgi:pimeloyl-ACP methyl ester carboxylesterase